MEKQKKVRAILVDDDEDELFYIEKGFVSSGYFDVLASAKSGEELFEIIHRGTNDLPDVIISDLNMPGINGFDILSKIQKNIVFSHIAVVILSTSSFRPDINKCINAGAIAYFTKPESFPGYITLAEDIYKRVV